MEFLLLAFFSFCQQITEESDSHRLLVPVGAQDLIAVAKDRDEEMTNLHQTTKVVTKLVMYGCKV
ncbi:hypothetical protein IIA28_19750 [candidate division KSB1 bacterium]|nr:hypothetical protein [candidate division KSB1 bacterium]